MDNTPPTRNSQLATRVFLTGYRGTGKTTVAKLVASKIGFACVDTDDLIEQTAGRSIAEIFADEGETAFRDREEQAVADACGLSQTVVALGGGALGRAANRERIAAAGPVVWLTADAATIARRVAADGTSGTRRPNLTAKGGLTEIESVLAERTPIYQAAADLSADTVEQTPEQVAAKIADWLASQ